jgi:hypothetical protein
MTSAGTRRILQLAASSAILGAAVAGASLLAQAPEPARRVKYAQINPEEMKAWLGYLASDELQGRQVFTEGYGLAASYVAGNLKAWGVKPLGGGGSYFEDVRIRGYRATTNSSVRVVSPSGKTTTFKHGDHVTFAPGPGGRQTLDFTVAEFIGYGQAADLQSRDVKDTLVIWMPNLAPAGGAGRGGGRGGAGAAINTYGAAAAIGFAPTPNPTEAERALTQAREALQKATEAVQQAQVQLQGGRGGAAGGRGRGAAVPDFTTVRRVDAPAPPQLTGDETFFAALFDGAPRGFADLKARADKGEPLSPTALSARITIVVDTTFETVSEQRTRNVVGLVEGTDPKLRDTYVMFGAHLDHVGYSQTGGGALPATTSCRSRSTAAQAVVRAAGRVVQNPGRGAAPAGTAVAGAGGRGGAPPVPFEQRDIINNGADDDGSGSTALLAIAKAFATGPKPRRSAVFIWHAGEESGLQGSRFNADFPVVPLDKVQAVLNMDMVGRDDCDNIEGDYTNSVFLVGADRISTDLHNLMVQTNAAQARPLTLDFELNDPLDPESVYTRSDHYSYAAKGIPITFFTTGLHPDYHRVSDSVDKILFPKLARIAQLVYQAGFSIADSERVLQRDNKGARTGFGSTAEVIGR